MNEQELVRFTFDENGDPILSIFGWNFDPAEAEAWGHCDIWQWDSKGLKRVYKVATIYADPSHRDDIRAEALISKTNVFITTIELTVASLISVDPERAERILALANELRS